MRFGTWEFFITLHIICIFYVIVYLSTGESGIEAFNEEARARNICISATEKIPHSANDAKFDQVIVNLRNKNKGNARVVILFLRVEDAKWVVNDTFMLVAL